MAKLKKTWKEKLNEERPAQVVEVNQKMSKIWGEGTCVIPSPLEVDGVMKMVPAGRLVTINQIREVMAIRYNASFG